MLAPLRIDVACQPQIGLVNKSGGLQSVILPLALKIARGKPTKLLVEHRHYGIQSCFI